MASIIQVNGKWRAQVRRKGYKTKTRTFLTKARAERWAAQIEGAIASGQVLPAEQLSDVTIKDFIVAYRTLRKEGGREVQPDSNEHYQLKQLEERLGPLRVGAVTPDDLVAFARARKEEDGAGPYTVNMNLSALGTVLRYGSVKLKVTPPDIVGAARPVLTYLRLIGPGNKRDRRPEEDEAARILEWLGENKGQMFRDAIEFAMRTAVRRGELAAIRWEDVNMTTRIINVLRKHPRKGKTLERIPILGPAWDLLMRQPRDPEDTRIFPRSGHTFSKYFLEACRALGIPGLRLHDLRHEGASVLFEQGYDIPQVALVTGHKDWKNLARYTNLRPEDLTKRDQAAAKRKESKKAATSR